jgi:hypothetical protein
LDHEVTSDVKGQLIIFIGARSEQSNRFKANVEVKIGQVVKRLESQAQKMEAEARVEANPQAKAKKGKELAELKARLEANMQRHLDLFAEIIARAPVQAQPSLETALQLTLKGYRTALEALGESKGSVETRLHLRTLHGSVEAINTQATEITVRLRGDASVTLKVTGDTQVLIGEKTGNLSNIAVGDQVKVRYASETSVATEIRVQTEAEAHGTIQSVDTAKGQLVIALANGATLTLKLTPNTNIEVNHKKATTADLKTNASVEVAYNIKTMEARKVEASTKAEVKGTVKAVNPASGTVTIRTEEGKEITVKVSNATKVDIQGLLFGILGISPGMTIKAEFDLTNGEAVELKARAEGRGEGQARAGDNIHGTIANIDSASGKLTVNLDGGGTLSVRATGDTRIEFNGQRVALADLQTGVRVKLEYNAEILIASEIEARSKPQVQLEAEAHGTVQALDAAKQTVTIRLRDGSTKVLALNADTVVRINGQPSAGADLTPGMELEARFRTDTGAALRINSTAKVQAWVAAHGTIASIDSAGGKVTVNLDGGGTLTVRATGDTQIELNGQLVALANLQTGARVKLEYSTDILIASAIEAQSKPQVQLEAEAHGTIQLLDVAKHLMTIRLRDGSTKELVLNADTVIRINGQPSAEADLKPGMEVEARFRTDNGAALRINTMAKVEAQAELRGKFKSLNAIAGQLVVETADGKSVVVFLDNTTKITKSGLLLTLLDITAGAQVKIQLKMGESRNVAETVEVLGTSGAFWDVGTSGQASASGGRSAEAEARGTSGVFLEVGGSGQASASGGPGTKGEANQGVEVEVKAH